MKKRITWLLAAMVLATGLLSGCGAADKPLGKMNVDKYVTLGDYSSLSVSVAPPAEVDASQVEQQVYDVYSRYVTAESGGITDRAVEIGDTVNINYEGKRDGVAFGGGTAAGALLTIGSGEFIDGFEDGLIGVAPGETVDLDLTFPDPYLSNPDLSGQLVVFTVTVNFIMPGIDDMRDEVIAAVGDEEVTTVDGLRELVYDYLCEVAQENYILDLRGAIISALTESCDYGELPENLLEESKKIIAENLEAQAAAYGYTADLFAMIFAQMSAEEFAETHAPDGVRQNLALQAIANREGLAVDDKELQSLLEETAANAGYASVDALVGEASREEFRNYFMSEKVMEFLMDRVKVEYNNE